MTRFQRNFSSFLFILCIKNPVETIQWNYLIYNFKLYGESFAVIIQNRSNIYISICCIMKLCGSYILLIYLISFSILKAEALNSLKFMYWIIKITNFTRPYKRAYKFTSIIFKYFPSLKFDTLNYLIIISLLRWLIVP